MERIENHFEKLCSFYVSDWHLVTMILPYINKEINKKANIVTILENDLEENIKTMLSKLRLRNEKEITEINWKSVDINQKENISNKVMQVLSNQKELNIIFINGKKEYIEESNCMILEELKKLSTELKNVNFKIVNCYEVTDFNGNIKEILDNHDKILNTSGEKEIGEIFEGYSKISDVG